jgi:hypothetical protein
MDERFGHCPARLHPYNLLHQDAGKAAVWLGNSVSILMAHYVVPKAKATCAEFWHNPREMV